MKNIMFLSLLILYSCTNNLNSPDNNSNLNSISQNDVLKMHKGEYKQLSATVLLENGDKNSAIIWTSSDNKIATVNQNGQINALKSGKVLIKAVSIQDKNKSKSFEINITNDLSIKPISVEILNTLGKNQIFENENLKLSATVKYDDGSKDNNIKWKISDENIGFINDQGLFIPKKSGSVQISAIANENIISSININIISKTANSLTKQREMYDLSDDYSSNKRENWAYGTNHGDNFSPFTLATEASGYSSSEKLDRYTKNNGFEVGNIWFKNYDKEDKLVILYPGYKTEDSVTIRFKAPESDFYKINYSFKPDLMSRPTVHLTNYRNNEIFFDTYYNMSLNNNISYDNAFNSTIYLNKDDYLYFSIDNGGDFPNNGNFYDGPEKNKGDFLNIRLHIER